VSGDWVVHHRVIVDSLRKEMGYKTYAMELTGQITVTARVMADSPERAAEIVSNGELVEWESLAWLGEHIRDPKEMGVYQHFMDCFEDGPTVRAVRQLE
jgi:hypothetical protein